MDMSHLPTLFVVDANLDGLFTLKEITDFAISERPAAPSPPLPSSSLLFPPLPFL